MPKRIVAWTAGVVGWLGADAVLAACPICYRIDDGPTSAGIRAAVVVLVAVTGAVLGGFGIFIARFVRRAHAMNESEGSRVS
jgi:hypothetical protein